MAEDAFIREAREVFQEDLEADRKNRIAEKRDYEFYAGTQWDDRDIKQREIDGRPCLTVNLLPQYARQVINDARIKPPAIAVRPADDGADKETAETYTGLIRNIEQTSRAEVAYIRGLEQSVIGGIGHWRVTTEYSSDDAWDLDIRIRPIFSPGSVVWDAGARMDTREDAQHVFVTDLLTQRAFKARFPKARPDEWWDDPQYAGWNESNGDFIRIAEYWWKEPTTRTLLLLANGATIDADSLSAESIARLKAEGLIQRDRKVETFKVRQTLMSGCEELADRADWPGKFLPVVPCIADEIDDGSQVVRRGLVRTMRDPQLLYNLHRSSLAESVAMAPKAKWIGTAKMFANYQALWAEANRSNQAFLPFEADPAFPAGPQRIAPEIPSAALLSDLQLAAQDVQQTAGIYRANLGEESNEKSGRAIIARQREGDTGTYHYIDNLGRAVAHTGRILVDMIPRIYDTERVVRVIGEDGSEELKRVNVATVGQDGQPAKIFDLSAGEYDVVVSIKPSYSTRREEARESMMTLVQAMPVIGQVAPDLMVGALDIPGADKIEARLRKTVPGNLLEPKEGEPPPEPPPPSPEQVIAQAELMKAQAMAKKAEVEAETKKIELAIEVEKTRQAGVKIEDEGNAKAVDAHVKLFNAAKPQPAPAGKFAG